MISAGGGRRKGAGRKPNTEEYKRHVLTFTDDEWRAMVAAAGGERKVSRYLARLHEANVRSEK